MIKEENNLWAKVITNKYGWNRDIVHEIHPRRDASNKWRGIIKTIPLIREGFRFNVRNGRQTRFWKDAWLGDKPLNEMVTKGSNVENEDECVAELWTYGIEWKWDKISKRISGEDISKLELITIKEDIHTKDELFWNREALGKFSVSSAYHIINNDNNCVQDGMWKERRKLKVPSKMIMFLWLVMHGRVMCNYE